MKRLIITNGKIILPTSIETDKICESVVEL